MNIGIIGLGRMGAAVGCRLVRAGFGVYGSDPDKNSCVMAQEQGIVIADLPALAQKSEIIWLMVPAGKIVDMVIDALLPHLREHQIVVDGGNSFFKDSQKRAQHLADRGIVFLDCGTSGGVHGKQHGFSLMIGGQKNIYDQLHDVWRAVAAPDGYGYVGSSGAGHYVKMVHNGIEYGLMQAYAEGFQLIKEGSFKDANLDLVEITRIWQHGAVIRSWLLDLSHDIFVRDQQLKHISGVVEESGTGKWTVNDAHEHDVTLPVIETALQVRAQSHTTGGNFATKVVALLRNAFGGHSFKQINNDKK